MAHVWAARALVPEMVAARRGLPAEHRLGGRPAHPGLGARLLGHQARGGGRGGVARDHLRRRRDQGLLPVPAGGAHADARRRARGPGRRGAAARRAGCSSPRTSPRRWSPAIRDERFLILPHPAVADHMALKATQPERWLRGMRRIARQALTPARRLAALVDRGPIGGGRAPSSRDPECVDERPGLPAHLVAEPVDLARDRLAARRGEPAVLLEEALVRLEFCSA